MNKNKQRKYKGFGFAEALVALMISGVVGIVLLSISATAIAELRRIEVQDLLAQYAVNTAIQIQKGAMDANTVNEFIAVRRQDASEGILCYEIDPEGFLNIEQGHFGEVIESGQSRINSYNDLKYRIYDENGEETEYFRYACVGGIDLVDRPNTIVMDIIVGSVKFKGQYTTDSDIKDFRYIAVINI